MRTLKVVYPHLLDIGCYSHTIDHVGKKFVTPNLDEFGKAWVGIFSHRHDFCGEKTGRYKVKVYGARAQLLPEVHR